MIKLFQSILSANRKRRCRAVRCALWLLRSVRDVELAEMCRYSDKLDELDSKPDNVSRRAYVAAEEGYSSCEDAIGFLESAIEDLAFAYCDTL